MLLIKLIDTVLRSSEVCKPLINSLLEDTVHRFEYLERPEQKPGVRIKARSGDMDQVIRLIDIGIAAEKTDRRRLAAQAVGDCDVSIIFAPYGLLDTEEAVVNVPAKGKVILLNVLYAKGTDAPPELLEFLDILREPEGNDSPASALGWELNEAIETAFYPTLLSAIKNWQKKFPVLARSARSGYDDVCFHNLHYLLAQEDALSDFFSQLTEEEATLSKSDIYTAAHWESPLVADIYACDDSYCGYALTIQSNDFGFSGLLKLLQGMAAERLAYAWDVHAAAICSYDALGEGRCYYQILPIANGLSVEIPSRVTYHILCVPSEGMERNAPGELQALLDHLAGGDASCGLLSLLREDLAGWRFQNEVRGRVKSGFASAIQHAYKGEELQPPFRLLEKMTRAYGEVIVAHQILRLNALILYYRDLVSVDAMAEEMKLAPESVRKVLRGGNLKPEEIL